ncbi:MAG: prepilin-type N-terminal cleavage/methylation domain-containing protein [Gemmatimonadetes bacterium]|nr:prepilin-type N-terminal cleavage/methylation domain-containing protein [Gemmatimonadota bacterium]
MRAVRRGFTLWEMALVLAVLAISLLLAAPAIGNFGLTRPRGDAEPLLDLLRTARGEAVFASAIVAVRLDPTSGAFRVDTTGVHGMGTYAAGHIDLGGATVFVSDLDRLQFLFQPSGASFADSVAVRGPGGTQMVKVDPWTGVARAEAR